MGFIRNHEKGTIVQQIFLDIEDVSDATISNSKDEYNHLTKSIRLSVGDHFEIINNNKKKAIATINEINNKYLKINIGTWEDDFRDLPIKSAIVISPLKSDRTELIVQKSTELGVDEIYVFQMKRSVSNWSKNYEKKIKRLQLVSKAAAEQSHRTSIPKLFFLNNEHEFINISKKFDKKIVAYEESAKKRIENNLDNIFSTFSPKTESVIGYFGPEGGIDEIEIEMLSKEEFQKVSLGPRILRAETAPIYFLSALSYKLEIERNNGKKQ